MIKNIVTEEDVLSANKDNIEKFKNMSFYELDTLLSLMEEKNNEFKENIDLKIYSNSIDKIDIITHNEYKHEAFQKRTFINAIKNLKYSDSFKGFNLFKNI